MHWNQDDTNWFALRVRPRWEALASQGLRGKGYETFLPLYDEKRRWSDRTKVIRKPLFPGYLFCRLTGELQGRVLSTPGVMHFVGVGRTPLPVEQREIEDIQAMVASGLAVRPWEYLEQGCRVRIEDGPLRNLEGILLSSPSEAQLIVNLTLLQRSVAVQVDRDWVTPVASSRPRPTSADMARPVEGVVA